MTDTLPIVLKWALIALALSPIWGALLWELWESTIKPRFIPNTELVREAKELIKQHGTDASRVAYTNEDRAWRYCDSFEQARWRRIRLKIEAISSEIDDHLKT